MFRIRNKENSKYNIHVFGTALKNGLNESNGNYICHGKYNREETTKLLKEKQISRIATLQTMKTPPQKKHTQKR